MKKRSPSLSAFISQGQQKIIRLKLKLDRNTDKNTIAVPLVASVSLPFDYDGELAYQWVLTENVVLSEGELSGKIKNLKANTNYPIEIKVTGFSSLENRQVIFKISGQRNGHKISSDAIVASKISDTFENTVQNVEKLKAEKN